MKLIQLLEHQGNLSQLKLPKEVFDELISDTKRHSASSNFVVSPSSRVQEIKANITEVKNFFNDNFHNRERPVALVVHQSGKFKELFWIHNQRYISKGRINSGITVDDFGDELRKMLQHGPCKIYVIFNDLKVKDKRADRLKNPPLNDKSLEDARADLAFRLKKFSDAKTKNTKPEDIIKRFMDKAPDIKVDGDIYVLGKSKKVDPNSIIAGKKFEITYICISHNGVRTDPKAHDQSPENKELVFTMVFDASKFSLVPITVHWGHEGRPDRAHVVDPTAWFDSNKLTAKSSPKTIASKVVVNLPVGLEAIKVLIKDKVKLEKIFDEVGMRIGGEVVDSALNASNSSHYYRAHKQLGDMFQASLKRVRRLPNWQRYVREAVDRYLATLKGDFSHRLISAEKAKELDVTRQVKEFYSSHKKEIITQLLTMIKAHIERGYNHGNGDVIILINKLQEFVTWAELDTILKSLESIYYMRPAKPRYSARLNPPWVANCPMSKNSGMTIKS